MAKYRRRKAKTIPLVVGREPSLWRFESVQEALSQNTHLIAQLILAGERVRRNEQPAPLPPSSHVNIHDGER